MGIIECSAFFQFQIATVTEKGVEIEGPLSAETNWDIAHMIRLVIGKKLVTDWGGLWLTLSWAFLGDSSRKMGGEGFGWTVQLFLGIDPFMLYTFIILSSFFSGFE